MTEYFGSLGQEVETLSSTVNSEAYCGTFFVDKIEGTINNENEPVDQFEAFLKQLNDKESNLSLLNTLIEDRLSVDTITEDMETSEVDTVSRNIKVIDSNSFEWININLPKLHLNKYSGNYSEWSKRRIIFKLINSNPIETDTLKARFGIQSFSKDKGFDLSPLLRFLNLEIQSWERASQINNHKPCHCSPPPQDR
ncbi:hypothetical protein TNCV_3300331 [Trichonephila clavipes]|nr:hypothetical protein TNCV_3300331 [Trichonephila clavipes]